MKNKYAIAVLLNEAAIIVAVSAANVAFGFGWAPLAVLVFGVLGFWVWNTLVAAAIKNYIYAVTPQVQIVNNNVEELLRDAALAPVDVEAEA